MEKENAEERDDAESSRGGQGIPYTLDIGQGPTPLGKEELAQGM